MDGALARFERPQIWFSNRVGPIRGNRPGPITGNSAFNGLAQNFVYRASSGEDIALSFDELRRGDGPRSGASPLVSMGYQCGPLCNPVSSGARPAKVSDPLVHTGAQTVLSCVGQPEW